MWDEAALARLLEQSARGAGARQLKATLLGPREAKREAAKARAERVKARAAAPSGRAKLWTAEREAALRAGAEAGRTRREVAEALGLPYETVKSKARAMGLDFARAPAPRPPATRPRDGERDAKIAAMRKDGRSYAAIGAALGITKNAALGAGRRLGLAAPVRAATPAPVAARAEPWPTRRSAPALRTVAFRADAGEPRPLRVGWDGLDRDHPSCRWPLGDPLDEAFRFCGAPQAAGRPYCAGHCELARRPK